MSGSYCEKRVVSTTRADPLLCNSLYVDCQQTYNQFKSQEQQQHLADEQQAKGVPGIAQPFAYAAAQGSTYPSTRAFPECGTERCVVAATRSIARRI
jgi:hypothetical protein